MKYNPVKVDINTEMIERAVARDHGKYNNRSFMDGKGNIVGFLGEYITNFIRPDFKHIDTFDYDFLWNEKKLM